MFEDTTIELWHDEAVTLADVLAKLRDWLVPEGEPYRMLDEFLGRSPGVFHRAYVEGALECIVLYSVRIAEQVRAAEQRAAERSGARI